MSIRFVEGCGSLPTSVVDGNLLVHSGENIVASIPLPFKKKFNGRLTSEIIRYANVLVFTIVDEDKILVMRYDGSWTIYTMDFIPIYFGQYDYNTVIKPYVLIDRFGSYKIIPIGYKKPRLYAAYLIRYPSSDIMHYTASYQQITYEVGGLDIPIVRGVYINGLNEGTDAYPCLEVSGDLLMYETFVRIPSKVIPMAHSNLQDKILVDANGQNDLHATMARRKAYGEVEVIINKKFTPPVYSGELIDLDYLIQSGNCVDGLPLEKAVYLMAVTMNLHQELLIGSAISGFKYEYVDNYGVVYINNSRDLWEEPYDEEMHENCSVAFGQSDYKLCGYVAKPVLEISTPTVLPRVATRDGKIFVGNSVIDCGGLKVASRPDPNMAGYQECVMNGNRAVIYLEDGSYKII